MALPSLKPMENAEVIITYRWFGGYSKHMLKWLLTLTCMQKFRSSISKKKIKLQSDYTSENQLSRGVTN